jgi:hypothetical protein
MVALEREISEQSDASHELGEKLREAKLNLDEMKRVLGDLDEKMQQQLQAIARHTEERKFMKSKGDEYKKAIDQMKATIAQLNLPEGERELAYTCARVVALIGRALSRCFGEQQRCSDCAAKTNVAIAARARAFPRLACGIVHTHAHTHTRTRTHAFAV